ncbi:MAG: hypothetical protein JKY33_01075 [Bacteroidia bacterium]|nr:hypothetical protein [Bacteroidia bacterium]
MKKITVLFSLIFIMISSISFAQEAEINNVRKKEFRGVRAIINEQTKESQGYYIFYVDEKAEEKGMIKFILEIYDLDLKLLKKTPITITKRSVIDGSVFNGKNFFFLFNDTWKKKITYVVTDINGEIIKEKVVEIEKRATTTADVYPANDAFYIVKPFKQKKLGYSITKIDKDLKEIWTVSNTPDKGLLSIEAVEAGSDRLILIELKRPSLISKKAYAKIMCLDDKTGKQLYEYPLFDGEATGIPSAFLIDKNGNVITGGMYFKGEKWKSVNSNGIFFLKLGPDGKKLVYKKVDWDEGIQELLKSSKNKLVIGSKPKVFFHDIVQAGDGGYQIISETFQKTMPAISSRLGDIISGRYIGNINAKNDQGKFVKPLRFVIMDFIIFNYNKDGEISNLNKIAKDETKISIYPPYDSMPGLKLAKAVKEFGYFDYAFTTKVPGNDQEVMVSRNMSIGNPYIGVTSIEQGKDAATTKIPIKRKTAKQANSKEKDFVGVVKSKPGYICVFYYAKKEQTVHLYLDKIKL